MVFGGVIVLPGSKAIARKEESRAKAATRIVNEMKESGSVAIVEGKHDVEALLKLGIRSITFERFRSDGCELNEHQKIFVFADIDDAGLRKQEKIMQLLDEKEIAPPVDDKSGPRLLNILGVPCVEQIVKPMLNIMRK